MELEDLYDSNFNKLNKTIQRRVDKIPDGCYVMMSYALIKNNTIITIIIIIFFILFPY